MSLLQLITLVCLVVVFFLGKEFNLTQLNFITHVLGKYMRTTKIVPVPVT